MAGFDITAATPILKQYYTKLKVETLVFKSSTFGVMPKDTSGGGSAYEGTVRAAIAANASFTDTTAFTNSTASSFKRWSVPWRSGYTRALVSGQSLDATRNDSVAFAKALVTETEGAYDELAQQIGAALWSNGGGAIGQISATSDVTTTTITLANPLQGINFRVGQVIKSAATDGTSGSVRANSVTLTKVNILTGELTASAAWSTITGCAALDYLFMDGDFGAAWQGIPAWIVPAANRGSLATTFNGVDRSVDPIRLAGAYFEGKGAPKKESLIQAGMILQLLGAKPSHVILHPLDFADISKDLTTNVTITTETAFKNPQIGFGALNYVAPFGSVKIMTDPFVPQGQGYILQMDTWKLASMEMVPQTKLWDNLQWLRSVGADQYEYRTLYRACTFCSMPGYNCAITF